LALYVHFFTILLELDVLHADVVFHHPFEAFEPTEVFVVALPVVFVVVLGLTTGILKSG
jgi:hypothetical protein